MSDTQQGEREPSGYLRLRNWAESQPGFSIARSVSAALEELEALRLRLREVEQERDDAKKIIAAMIRELHPDQHWRIEAWVGHYAVCARVYEEMHAAESRLAQAGKLAEAARILVFDNDWDEPDDLPPQMNRLKNALLDFDSLASAPKISRR